MHKLYALVALLGLMVYCEASDCSALNVNNAGCFCGHDNSKCPHSECRLFCASRYECSASNIICDYPMTCNTKANVCGCSAIGMKPTSGAACCSGLAPGIHGKCGKPGICVKDMQCLRFADQALQCDLCVNGACKENPVKNCGLGSENKVEKTSFGL